MSSQASAKKQAVVPFDVETSKAAEQRALSEEGIITVTATAIDELLPPPRRCCDCICNSCLFFYGNPCCGMRTASIVCNVIALCWTVFYILLETVSWQEEFWNQYPDGYETADDFASLSPEEQEWATSFITNIKLTLYLEMAFCYAGLLCLVMAIVGNVKYQWKMVVPLFILRVLAFSVNLAPAFMPDGSNLMLLLLSYPNWKFVSEVRKGILTRPATSGGHQSLPTEDNFGHAVV